MKPNEGRITYLLDVYTSALATNEEKDELMDWVSRATEDSEMKRYMLRLWNEYKPKESATDVNWENMFSRIEVSLGTNERQKVRRMVWGRYAVAASVFLLVTIGVLLYYTSNRSEVKLSTTQNTDIAPPSASKAILTLADGSKVEIDDKHNGVLAVQGGVQIIKQSNDEVVYNGKTSSAPAYNELAVPVGSKPVNLTLSDGSRIWLNVGSSLSYPTSFSGMERKVRLTGEAYFEVSHESGKPFKVEHDDFTIKVLGTHFNVNTYDDERDDQITLLEGSVEVSKRGITRILKPGQQALVPKNEGSIRIKNKANMEAAMAWQAGKFWFDDNTDMSSVLRQIARWYNVDIEMEGKIDQRFWGSISKNVDLNQVLKILEATGGVKFVVESGKIIAIPVK